MSNNVKRCTYNVLRYFSFANASLILGTTFWISSNALAPTDALNQFTSSSVPKAANGTKATLASLMR